MNKQTKFFLYAAGIFVSYFYFGILQEKITRTKYVREVEDSAGGVTKVAEKYTYALSLVLAQCLASYVFAKLLSYARPETVEDKTPSIYYAITAVTYLLAMVCSNMALQWVPYPTQVIGKSAKPIPILLLGVLIGNRSYPLRKYLFVFLVVLGVVLFMYKDKKERDAESTFGIGEVLLLLSLTMDGLTGAVQERTRALAKPTGPQMMLATNGWSCLYLTVALLCTGEFLTFFYFVRKFPFVIVDIFLLSVAGAIGQLFIYSMVSDFGPLPVSLITTTRKFFTVLASVVFFNNPLIARQWVGAVTVFAGLFLDAYFSKSGPKKKIESSK